MNVACYSWVRDQRLDSNAAARWFAAAGASRSRASLVPGTRLSGLQLSNCLNRRALYFVGNKLNSKNTCRCPSTLLVPCVALTSVTAQIRQVFIWCVRVWWTSEGHAAVAALSVDPGIFYLQHFASNLK